ncbi:MAG: transporter [Azoarcus sp.]|jgi:hypothetical protein|nr:transporter [Azoarcus sp.]
MKNIQLKKALGLIFLATAAFQTNAADENTGQASPLLRAVPPVNVNLSAAGTLPKGVLFSALNVSFANKEHSERGYAGSEIRSSAWLLKLRYGLTDSLELAAITPYVDLSRSNPTPHPKHVRGVGDQIIGFSFAPYNLRMRDPYSLHFTAALALPTGREGTRYRPGNDAWGWRLGTAYGIPLTPSLRLDTELVWSGPFERGNQGVRRGQNFQWNAQLRHAFRIFDVALESSVVRQESGNRETPAGQINLRNGYTEWFAGPSMNLAVDALGTWMGAGVFFPISRHFDGPSPSERYRLEFKIGKIW